MRPSARAGSQRSEGGHSRRLAGTGGVINGSTVSVDNGYHAMGMAVTPA